MKEQLKTRWEHVKNPAMAFLKWLGLAVFTGGLIGLAGVAFLHGIQKATATREQYGWILWLLPLAGVTIVFLYHASGIRRSRGTDLVLLSVRSPEPVPLRMAPLIFAATVLTHLFGGSAGREGAALQMGGSLGFQLGRLFRLDEKDLHIMTMCGMSAAFSALFGTPVASAVFAMEVVSVGVMYYAALVPCAVAALVGAWIARFFGTASPHYTIAFPAAGHFWFSMSRVLLLAALCAGLSAVFCYTLQVAGQLYQRYLKNQYLRAAVGGFLFLGMVLLFQTRDYLGIGETVMAAALSGSARPEAFLLKLLFTAVTLGAGYKGGEIMPAFFVGATFGCTMGGLLGMNSAFGAALGLIALFAGVTNCPLTALLLGVELFGAEGLPFYLLTAAVSYMLSGYTGLYRKQQILYSKTKAEFLGASDQT